MAGSKTGKLVLDGDWEVTRSITVQHKPVDEISQSYLLMLLSERDIPIKALLIEGQTLKLTYDVTEVCYTDIERTLLQIGYVLDATWWYQLKRWWFQSTERNLREMAHSHPKSCCNRRPVKPG